MLFDFNLKSINFLYFPILCSNFIICRLQGKMSCIHASKTLTYRILEAGLQSRSRLLSLRRSRDVPYILSHLWRIFKVSVSSWSWGWTFGLISVSAIKVSLRPCSNGCCCCKFKLQWDFKFKYQSVSALFSLSTSVTRTLMVMNDFLCCLLTGLQSWFDISVLQMVSIYLRLISSRLLESRLITGSGVFRGGGHSALAPPFRPPTFFFTMYKSLPDNKAHSTLHKQMSYY